MAQFHPAQPRPDGDPTKLRRDAGASGEASRDRHADGRGMGIFVNPTMARGIFTFVLDLPKATRTSEVGLDREQADSNYRWNIIHQHASENLAVVIAGTA
jgi:hypothetical protein